MGDPRRGAPCLHRSADSQPNRPSTQPHCSYSQALRLTERGSKFGAWRGAPAPGLAASYYALQVREEEGGSVSWGRGQGSPALLHACWQTRVVISGARAHVSGWSCTTHVGTTLSTAPAGGRPAARGSAAHARGRGLRLPRELGAGRAGAGGAFALHRDGTPRQGGVRLCTWRERA